MTMQFLNKFEDLKASLTAMCARSCALYKDAICALRDLDGKLADEIIDRDTEIDRLEIEIQNQCQDLLTYPYSRFRSEPIASLISSREPI